MRTAKQLYSQHSLHVLFHLITSASLVPVGHLIPGQVIAHLLMHAGALALLTCLALIICMSILAFVILVIIPCCIYCCCCRKKSGPSRRALAESAKYEQERTEREARHAERRNDREKKYDEIRAKYGAPGTRGASSSRASQGHHQGTSTRAPAPSGASNQRHQGQQGHQHQGHQSTKGASTRGASIKGRKSAIAQLPSLSIVQK
uniref:Uncharacterized protein n=1 Tax=Macrostomum lignano TaxID=282301 RepID=A0A1I8JQ40_9PLAT